MAPSSNPRPSRSGGEDSSRPTVWRASLEYRPGLRGKYPGQECVLTLPGTRVTMTLCWCPDSGEIIGFWIAKHLVSQAQWEAVMGDNPSNKGRGPDHPVDSVSWEDAQKFCKKCGLRLPTEKEWEYACRAGTETDFAVGDGLALNAQWANFNGDYPEGEGPSSFKWAYRERTLPQGFFPPNAWGLHDTHGQLWEWCADKNYGDRQMLRGGAFLHDSWPHGSGVRRNSLPATRGKSFGVRPRSAFVLNRSNR
jgi:formylglycine-generating enzyme required for sulfatase activity